MSSLDADSIEDIEQYLESIGAGGDSGIFASP